MKTRSIVIDVCGSYVRYKGGAIAIGDMAEILSWFGVTEDATRVTMSRMRREGWFTSRRNGRTSYYELSDRSWTLLKEGHPRIFDRHRADWRGEWHIVVLQHDQATSSAREQIRKQMAWRGYAQMAPATWIAASDRTEGLSEAILDGTTVQSFASRTASSAADLQLATTHWNLDELADDYEGFIRTYESLISEDAIAELSEQEALVLRTEITHEYRLFPFRDPDLPAELLPNAWPGYQAHSLFRHVVDALANPAWAAFDAVYDQPPPANS